MGPWCKTPCYSHQEALYIREIAMLLHVQAAHVSESMSCFPAPAESMFCFAAPVGHALIMIVCNSIPRQASRALTRLYFCWRVASRTVGRQTRLTILLAAPTHTYTDNEELWLDVACGKTAQLLSCEILAHRCLLSYA